MKLIDNPRRNINVPGVEGWRLDGLGGIRRTGEAMIAVDPGPPQQEDGPQPSRTTPVLAPSSLLIATSDVPIELGAVQQFAALGRLNSLPAAQSEAFRVHGLVAEADSHSRMHVERLVGTPDLHRGDAGIAIGTVLAVANGVLPLGPGPDIGCGMARRVARFRPLLTCKEG
jgi:hypothetical protein